MQDQLNIALLSYRSHQYVGGQGIYIYYLAKALTELGHKVDVISGQPYPELPPNVNLIKLPSLNLFENSTNFRSKYLYSFTDFFEWFSKCTGGFAEPYTFGRRVEKYLLENGDKYDVIHDNQSLSWGILSLQKKFPVVSTIHHPIQIDYEAAIEQQTDSLQRSLIKRWFYFLHMQRSVASRLRHVVTVTDQSKEDIIRTFGVPRDNISVVYNGIDTDHFRPMPELDRDPYHIVTTASSDQPLKGLKHLIAALKSLVETHPNVTLSIIGKLSERGHNSQLIQKLGLTEHIKYHCQLTTQQICNLYAKATIAVVPSEYEGFGFPAGEAMACGVPIVATKAGGLTEVVGDAGIMIPPKEPQPMAEAIRTLINSPQQQKYFSEKGLQRIQSNFSWKEAALKISNLYKTAIRSHDTSNR